MHHNKIISIIILLCVSLCGCNNYVGTNNSESTLLIQNLETSSSESVSSLTEQNPEEVESEESNLLTSEFEVIEKEAVFDKYEIPSREIAEEYFNTNNISGVDTALMCFDGEFIYAVLSCYQEEMSQLPDLGELVIKYSIASSAVEILMVQPAGDMVRKMVLCEQNLFWINSLEEWVIYRYDIEKDEITVFAQADSETEYTGSTAISAADGWFIYCEYFGKSDFKVHFYSSASREEVCFNQTDFKFNSPFWMPDIEEDKALVILSKWATAKVAIMDLNLGERMQEIDLSDGYGYGFIDGNGYIMYSNDYSYNNIWLYEMESGIEEKLYLAGEDVFQLRKYDGNFIIYRRYNEQPKFEIWDTKNKIKTIYEMNESLGQMSICGEYLLFYNGRYVSIFKE